MNNLSLNQKVYSREAIEITSQTPIAALTVSQFFDLLEKSKENNSKPVDEPQPKDFTKGYVYGLKGIRKLFNVSHPTAQRYKNTILKPAVRQNGKKIVVDVEKALELFDEYNKNTNCK